MLFFEVKKPAHNNPIDVIICSFSKTSMESRLAVALDIWDSCLSLSADYERADEITPEVLQSICKSRSVSWIVLLRGDDKKNSAAKIRHVNKKIDVEVGRNEISEQLNALNSSVQTDSRIRNVSSSSMLLHGKSFDSFATSSMFNITPCIASKSKNQKQIIDKGTGIFHF